MKMNYGHQAVTKSSSSLETSQARILMTPEMLELLSSGVYQYKERAVIRELCCNALDGHVLKGNPDEPFEVHLPTDFEPFFEVRDNGVGLSHDDVMGLYMDYGASTKNESDDYIGAMGIGSKSPFAISDSFTVRSFFDGVVTTYQVYKEEGIPQVTKLMQKPMLDGEHTGLAVRVPVRKDKIQLFRREATYVFETFKVRPEVNVELTYFNREGSTLSEKKGEYIAFAEHTHAFAGSSVYLIMGSIRYPIDTQDCFDEGQMGVFLGNPIVSAIKELWIYAPIGTVSISASRESLQLNDATKEIVRDAYQNLLKEFVKDVQCTVDAHQSVQEVGYWWCTYSGRLTLAEEKYLGSQLTYDGKSLLDWQAFFDGLVRQPAKYDDGSLVYQKDFKGNFLKDDKGELVPMLEAVPLDYYKAYHFRGFGGAKQHSSQRFDKHPITNKCSPFRTISDFWKDTVFFVYDRVTKSGTPKPVGKDAVICEMVESFERADNPVCIDKIFNVKSKAEAEYYWDRFFVPKESRNFAVASDFEYAYVPQKREKSMVKVYSYHLPEFFKERESFAISNGRYPVEDVQCSEDRIDLSALRDDGRYHLYLKCSGGEVVDGIFKGESYRDIAKSLASLIDGNLVVFNKANWKKIPEEWDNASDEAVLTALVEAKPMLWKALNEFIICYHQQYGNIGRVVLKDMGVVESGNPFRRRFYASEAGRVIEMEGAYSIYKTIYKRPQYHVREFLSRCKTGESADGSILYTLVNRMVSSCKLAKRIRLAKSKMNQKIKDDNVEPYKKPYRVLKLVKMKDTNLLDLAKTLDIPYDESYVLHKNNVDFYHY